MIIIFFFVRYAKKKQEQEGKRLPVLIISSAIFIGLPLLTFLIGGVDLSWSFPVIRQMSQSSYTFDGGLKIPPELIALLWHLRFIQQHLLLKMLELEFKELAKVKKRQQPQLALPQVRF